MSAMTFFAATLLCMGFMVLIERRRHPVALHGCTTKSLADSSRRPRCA
jgi:hypothetical protein